MEEGRKDEPFYKILSGIADGTNEFQGPPQSMENADITLHLHRMVQGDQASAELVFTELRPRLMGIAKALMSRRGPDVSMQIPTLVSELYIKLRKDPARRWSDRHHFINYAALAMLWTLRDYSRKRKLHTTPLNDVFDQCIDRAEKHSFEFLDFARAVEKLVEFDPQMATAVGLYVSGFKRSEVVAALGMAEATFDHRWVNVKAYLRRELDLESNHVEPRKNSPETKREKGESG